MKFNSQICTTREQSERLIALGLKKETADMYYSYDIICAKPYYKVMEFMNGCVPEDISPLGVCTGYYHSITYTTLSL